MKKKRRFFSSADKVTIIKRHLIDKTPISDFPTVIGGRTRMVFEYQGLTTLSFT